MGKKISKEDNLSVDRILRLHLFIPSLNVGGAQRFFVNLANHFVENDMQVTIYTLLKGGELEKTLLPSICVKCLTNGSCNKLNYIDILLALFRSIKIFRNHSKGDATISTLTGMNVFTCVSHLISGNKTPLILREAVVKDNRRSIVLSFLVFLYRFSDCVVAVSKEVKNDLCHHDRLNKNKVLTINNPVDSTGIRFLASQPNMHPWFLEKNIYIIVAVGRLVYQKGFDILIKSMSIVTKELPVRLIIVGDGELKGELNNICDKFKVKHIVDFVGSKDNPYSYMSNSDLFVLPSRWEGFVNVLVEGVLCAPRVVSSNCRGGPAQILEGGLYGRLFDSENEKSLAEEIIKSLKQDKEKDLSKWMKKYEPDMVFGKYKKLLNNIALNNEIH